MPVLTVKNSPRLLKAVLGGESGKRLRAAVAAIKSGNGFGPPVELDRETDGRWIAEIPSMPGVMAYGDTEADATRNVRTLERKVKS